MPKITNARSLKTLKANQLLEQIKQCRVGSSSNHLAKLLGKFLYLWRHPLIRLICPFYILFSDLYVHSTDPVDHSEIEYQMGYAGECLNLFLWTNQPMLSFPQKLFKLSLAIFCGYAGLRIPYEIRMTKWGRKTEWLNGPFAAAIPLFTWMIVSVIVSQSWNLVLEHVLEEPFPDDQWPNSQKYFGQRDTKYLTGGMQTSWRTTANIIGSWVFFLDIFSVLMVIDLILQDTSQYPEATQFRFRGQDYNLRKIWVTAYGGKFRIWFTMCAFAAGFFFGITFVWIISRQLQVKSGNHPKPPWRFFSQAYEKVTTAFQFSRTLIYGSQFLCDSITVMQDWEFPTFENQLQVAFLGSNIVLEGRFFNYMVMLGMMGVDARAAYNSGRYPPQEIGQFTDATHNVWAITNWTWLMGSHAADIIENSTWDARAELGCFEKSNLTVRETYEKYSKAEFPYCKELTNAARRNQDWELNEDLGVWMADGVNQCCDVRLVPLFNTSEVYWDSPPLYVQGYGLPNRGFIIMIPFAVSALLGCLLTYVIPRSRKELVRRAVISYELASNSETTRMKKAKKQKGQLFGAGRQFVEERLEYVRNLFEIDTRVGNEQDEEDDEVAEDDSKNDSFSGATKYPIVLKKPPYKQAPLLLVCSKGIFSVQSGIDATIADLTAKLEEFGINDPVPLANVRLRSQDTPWKRLDSDLLIGSLMPGKATTSLRCIYLHCTLNSEKSKLGADTLWGMMLNIFRGLKLGLWEILGSLRVLASCWSTTDERKAECENKLRIPLAFTLILHGGQMPIEAVKLQEDQLEQIARLTIRNNDVVELGAMPSDGGVTMSVRAQASHLVRELDKDGDGALTAGEILAALDKDGDGKITKDELRALFETGHQIYRQEGSASSGGSQDHSAAPRVFDRGGQGQSAGTDRGSSTGRGSASPTGRGSASPPGQRTSHKALLSPDDY